MSMLILESEVDKRLNKIGAVDSGTVHIQGSSIFGTRLDFARDQGQGKRAEGFLVGKVKSLVTNKPEYNATFETTWHNTLTTFNVKITANLLTGSPAMVKLDDIITISTLQVVAKA